MEVKKVKIVKGKTMSIEFVEDDGTTVKEDHTTEVHKDLKDAMAGLRIHFAVLSDYVKIKQVPNILQYDEDPVTDFTVTGISIGGDDDAPGVVITGLKTTPSGKSVLVNTLFAGFTDDSETAYHHITDLEFQVEAIMKEAILCRGGKKAPDPQLAMDFPEPSENGDKSKTAVAVLEPEPGSAFDQKGIIGPAIHQANSEKKKKK